MTKQDNSSKFEADDDDKMSSAARDHRKDGIRIEGNQSVHIEGDVISAGQVNKVIVNNPDLLNLFWHRFDKALRLSDAPDHLRTSWAGWFIYVLHQLTGPITVYHWRAWITTLTLWVATVWLVAPILQWPLVDLATRGRACVLYAIATLVMPVFVALTAPTDRQAEMKLDSRGAQARLWLLKLTGAYVGFALMTANIGVAVIAYHLGWALPRGVQWLLILIALGFSHIGARRIPADRLKMFGELRIHEMDRLAMVVYVLVGPGVAAFVYWGYEVLANPGMGLLVLLGLTGLALWEVRQRRRRENIRSGGFP